MNKKKDVDTFLAELELLDKEKYIIMQELRQLFSQYYPNVAERIIYGGIMFTLNQNDIGGIFPSKKHVSFEFSQGYLLKDPDNMLEGKGKYRRHLKIKSLDDISKKHLEYYLKQIRQS